MVEKILLALLGEESTIVRISERSKLFNLCDFRNPRIKNIMHQISTDSKWHLLMVAGDAMTTPTSTLIAPVTMRSNLRCDRNRPYICSVCQESFASKSSYQNHLDFHMGKTTCKICKQICSSRQNLALHIPTHQGSIPCELCGSKFSTNMSLYLHKHTTKLWKGCKGKVDS